MALLAGLLALELESRTERVCAPRTVLKGLLVQDSHFIEQFSQHPRPG